MGSRGNQKPLRCNILVEERLILICGVKTVLFAGNRWRRNIPPTRFLALAGSTFGRASRNSSDTSVIGRTSLGAGRTLLELYHLRHRY